MTRKITEKELAAQVVAWLVSDDWEVYQEVTTNYGLIDLVAKKGQIVWAIECKLAFGFPVLEQAHRVMGHAHYVSVAVLDSARWRGLGVKLCHDYGIGILSFDRFFRSESDPQERIKPKLFRKPVSIPELKEEQKSMCEAGGNRGGHWTPFKATVKLVINLVKRSPGIEFGELIKGVDHHYSTPASAKSCIRGFIGTSVIPEIEFKTVNKRLCVFPTENMDR